jgi:hypothetical protein
MPAPRHLLPALPFLAVPLAEVWRRARALVIVTASIGAMVMAAPTLLGHLIPVDVPYLDWYRSLLDGPGLVPSVFTIAAGSAGWVLHLVVVAGAAVWLAREVTRDQVRVSTVT